MDSMPCSSIDDSRACSDFYSSHDPRKASFTVALSAEITLRGIPQLPATHTKKVLGPLQVQPKPGCLHPSDVYHCRLGALWFSRVAGCV